MLASKTDGKAQTTTYSYDHLALGQTGVGSFMIGAQYSPPNAGTTGHLYVDDVTATGADASKITYSYDGDGNRVSMVDGTGTTAYAYNALNQQTTKMLPTGNTVSYTWDGENNLLTKADAGGTVTHTYSSDDQVASVADPQNRQTWPTTWTATSRRSPTPTRSRRP